MAVVIDAGSSAASGTNVASFTHTPVGTPTAVVVGVDVLNFPASQANLYPAGVTYNGVALTLVTSASQFVTGDLRGLSMWVSEGFTPASGAQTVALTYNSTPFGVVAGCASVTGSVTSSIVTDGSVATGSSSTASVDVTSAAGELVIDVVAQSNAAGAQTAGAGQTQVPNWNATYGGSARGTGSYEDGAGTVTMSRTLANSGAWYSCGLSIAAAGGGGGSAFPATHYAMQWRHR
jgi:hypothetical protein